MCERCLSDFYSSGKARFQSTWTNNADFQKVLSQLKEYRQEAANLGLPTPFPPHPKMEKLNYILAEHFNTPDADETRVMVFTNFRESVDEIVAHLNAHESGKIRAHKFIGQAGGKGGEKGMRQKEQIAVSIFLQHYCYIYSEHWNKTISRFKAGEFNVLVATSIGEEGLDIGEIDLIVCYDAQKAPVRMVSCSLIDHIALYSTLV
jgi:ATP-dependent DNA helicase MPH1